MAGPLIIEPFVFYERPAGAPPLYLGSSECADAPPRPIAAPLAVTEYIEVRKIGSRISYFIELLMVLS